MGLTNRLVPASDTSDYRVYSHLILLDFRAARFRSTSKSSVCWDPLQTLAKQVYILETLLHSQPSRCAAGCALPGQAESSRSVSRPDTYVSATGFPS